jgi:O-antigen/teichoic acid export membrane protein
MTKVANIAKNTSYFTFALIIQKVISFSYFLILGRFFIPDDLGKYYLAISLTSIFAIFIDLGLSNVLTREIAKAQEKASHYLSSVIFIKLPLALLALLGLVATVNIINYQEITRHLVYLSSICMLLDSFTSSFFACLRGFHNLKYESIAAIIFQAIVFVFGITAVNLGFGLYLVMLALVSASIFNFSYSLFLVKTKQKLKLFLKVDPELIKAVFKISIPFAVFGIYQKLYMYLDTVFLSILAEEKHVGLYQVAFKIVFALQFLPMAFTASLYPAFSSYWKTNREQLPITFERAINYLIIISLPISIGTIAIADKILLVFRPEYAEAKLSMQIIMLALIFIFVNFPIGSLLNACDRQHNNTRNMGITLIASIILNLILIPKYQTDGAALTVLITNFLMFILGMLVVPRIIKVRYKKILLILAKTLSAAALMASFVFYFKNFLNIFVVIILAGIIYFTVLFILKAFHKEDIISIYKSFKKS